jgi:hypothetical protein
MGKPNQTGFNSGKIQLIPLPSDNTRIYSRKMVDDIEIIGAPSKNDSYGDYGNLAPLPVEDYGSSLSSEGSKFRRFVPRYGNVLRQTAIKPQTDQDDIRISDVKNIIDTPGRIKPPIGRLSSIENPNIKSEVGPLGYPISRRVDSLREVSQFESGVKKAGDLIKKFTLWEDGYGNPSVTQGLYNTVGKSAMLAGSLYYGAIPVNSARALLTRSGALSTISNMYLGGEMADFGSDILEGATAGVGRFAKPHLNEHAKKIGGFNDLRQSVRSFRSGEYGKGAFNLATGIGGVYDSSWMPGRRWMAPIDTMLEGLNIAGDTYDTYNAAVAIDEQLKTK